jgi:aminopeptidase N
MILNPTSSTSGENVRAKLRKYH